MGNVGHGALEVAMRACETDLAKLISWKPGEAVPYKVLADTFEAIAEISKRLTITSMLVCVCVYVCVRVHVCVCVIVNVCVHSCMCWVSEREREREREQLVRWICASCRFETLRMIFWFYGLSRLRASYVHSQQVHIFFKQATFLMIHIRIVHFNAFFLLLMCTPHNPSIGIRCATNCMFLLIQTNCLLAIISIAPEDLLPTTYLRLGLNGKLTVYSCRQTACWPSSAQRQRTCCLPSTCA